MARARSLNDLYRISNYATNRIVRGTGSQLSKSAQIAANNGIDNIENSAQYKRADAMFVRMQQRGATREQLGAFYDRENERPYSERVYKGLANG